MKKDTDNTEKEAVAQPVEVTPQTYTGATPQSWTEVAYVNIAPQGYGELAFGTLLSSIDLKIGEQPVDFIPNLAGGRIAAHKPAGDAEITLDIYSIGTSNDSWPANSNISTSTVATGAYDLMQGENAAGNTEMTLDSITRQPIRMTILQTDLDPASVTSATMAISAGTYARRMSLADGYITNIDESQSEDPLKSTITAKFGRTDKSSSGCIMVENAINGSDTLAAMGAYTSTTKFR